MPNDWFFSCPSYNWGSISAPWSTTSRSTKLMIWASTPWKDVSLRLCHRMLAACLRLQVSRTRSRRRTHLFSMKVMKTWARSIQSKLHCFERYRTNLSPTQTPRTWPSCMRWLGIRAAMSATTSGTSSETLRSLARASWSNLKRTSCCSRLGVLLNAKESLSKKLIDFWRKATYLC